MSELRKLGGDELLAVIQEIAKRFGDGKHVPVGPDGRVRTCLRCEKLRPEFDRHDPEWVPPTCESWVSGGRRYWSSTCRACGEIEAAQRESARRARMAGEEPQSPRPTLGLRSKLQNMMNGGKR